MVLVTFGWSDFIRSYTYQFGGIRRACAARRAPALGQRRRVEKQVRRRRPLPCRRCVAAVGHCSHALEPRRRSRSADDQLGPRTRSAAGHTTAGSSSRAATRCTAISARPRESWPTSRQIDMGEAGQRAVVETDHRDLLGHKHSRPDEHIQDAQRTAVVEREDRRRQRVATLEQCGGGRPALALGDTAGEHRLPDTRRRGRLPVATPAFGRARRAPAFEVGDSAVAEPAQVCDRKAAPAVSSLRTASTPRTRRATATTGMPSPRSAMSFAGSWEPMSSRASQRSSISVRTAWCSSRLGVTQLSTTS